MEARPYARSTGRGIRLPERARAGWWRIAATIGSRLFPTGTAKARRGGVLPALLFLSLLLTACQGQGPANSAVRMALTVTPPAPAVGPAGVAVTVQRPDGTPVTGAKLQLRGDMTMAGMAPVLAPLADRGDGRYVASGFRFTMGGDWVLTVSGTLPDGQSVHHTFTINNVGVAGPPASPTPTR